MPVPLNSGIKAAVHGVLIAEKANSSRPFQAARSRAVFWNRQGVLLVEFLPQGITTNSTACCETMKKRRRAIQNKSEACLLEGLCCFMTMLGRAPPLELKLSSRHLAGNNSVTPPYSPRLSAKWLSSVPAPEEVPCWPAFPQRWRRQRSSE